MKRGQVLHPAGEVRLYTLERGRLGMKYFRSDLVKIRVLQWRRWARGGPAGCRCEGYWIVRCTAPGGTFKAAVEDEMRGAYLQSITHMGRPSPMPKPSSAVLKIVSW